MTTVSHRAKSVRTRARILDAAATVLSRSGYAGTRLGDVAELAGVQAPAIYYYFDSREALIAEVMVAGSRSTRQHVAEVLAALPPGTSPLARIDAAVEAHMRFILQISDYATASTRNMGQLPPDIRQLQYAEQVLYRDIWRELLSEASEHGAIEPGMDLGMARMLLHGALNWTPEWWSADRGSIDEVVAAAQRFIRSGLGASTEAP